ncbi:MAG TPA: polyprenyl synthetase family protein [Candidatus Deferrimicrobium sp.]|nr:polyprenyl synthetase family protein [Candidatus Deferrimicrobium sp.]
MTYITEKTKIIETKIQQFIAEWNFQYPLNKVIPYILESGGKHIRPILSLLSCEAVNGQVDAVIKPAIAIELIHNASLLWDDVIDADELRRGKITVHKKWDKNVALLTGGLLASKALELISDKPEILDLYVKAIGKMIEGQVLDISNNFNKKEQIFESKNEKEIFEILRKRFQQKALEGIEWEESGDLSLIADFTEFEEERDYFEMISYKTSALIKLAARIGASLGGGTPEEIQALANYGLYLGLAFQVRDDLIGILSSEKTLGKPIASDLRQRKLNLYTIFALRNLNDEELQEFLNLMQDSTLPDNLQKLNSILEKSGAFEYTKTKLKLLAQKARSSLDALHNSEAKQILNQLITFTIERDF